MKKYLLAVIVVVIILLLALLGYLTMKTESMVVADDVEEVHIIEYSCGGKNEYFFEGKQLQYIINWIEELKYVSVEFNEGESPADKNGECAYDIELYTSDSDECINEFTYFEDENTAYIRMEDEWYKAIKFSQIPINH